MYQGSSCGYGRSGGYGVFRDLSNCSPISYGRPGASYGGIAGYSCSQSQSCGTPRYSVGEELPQIKRHYANISPLEVVLEDASPVKQMKYTSTKTYAGLYLSNKQNYFPTDVFLSSERPETPFVETRSDIMPYITQAFEQLTGSKFPEHRIKVNVLDDAKFEKAHASTGGKCSPGVKGFALNRQGKGLDEIFVRKDHLDRMMLTIGHEIGHVMSPTLPDARDEEAKAFAFSIAWMKTIKEHNIAGIGNYIIPEPAKNGLHDVAFEYLLELIQKGKSAMQLFKELAKGILTINKRIEVIYR